MSTILLIIIIVLIVGSVGTAPIWPHSASFGPWPSSAIGVIVIVLVILLLLGKL